jgi:pyrroline-5-carboxylate reductase
MKKIINTQNNLVEMIIRKKIGFLGVGQMGGVLLNSFSSMLNEKFSKSHNENFNNLFYMHDPLPGKKEEYVKLGFNNFLKNEIEVFKNSKIIFTCVKPDQVKNVLSKTKELISKDSLIVSIAAGIPIEYMESLYRYNNKKIELNEKINENLLKKNYENIEEPKIIRIMSNHLCTINEAGSVYSVNKKCETEDEELIQFLLQNIGLVKKIDEKLMNPFTALTGSGPAFVYHFIESLVDASLKNGIDVVTAREYAVQTVYASALFVKNTDDKNPNGIQYVVTTPKGTTIAGLNQLNKYAFKYAVSEAITKASERGEEIEKAKMAELEIKK